VKVHPQTNATRADAIEPALLRIPEGWFLMGSDTGQDNERPVHRVWVDEFYLAARQLTHQEYARFLQDTGKPPPPCWTDPSFNHPQQPVVAVSWFEAVAYCDWATEKLGREYRLPTEAEWERAARGSAEGKQFPWGDESPETRAQYSVLWKAGPEPVGRSLPNSFGLHEICENVHEWCGDWYSADYYAVSPDRNPRGPDGGTRRSSRGGSWRHHIKISRCSARSSIPPEFQYADYGFRIAASR
jgi:formylglycine-generating enzyme